MNLATPQTGAGGQTVRRLLIEEGAEIADELYLGMVVDRARQQVAMMASAEGGMEIEEVAARSPEKIRKIWAHPTRGLDKREAREVAREIGAPEGALDAAVDFMGKLGRVFAECDASLVEINPLVVTKQGELLALDAKMNFDDNALFRQEGIAALRDADEEDAAEAEAAEHDLSYISLDGNIGCMVNGAGWRWRRWMLSSCTGGSRRTFWMSAEGRRRKKWRRRLS